jgi:hypothetical protein
MERPKMCYYCNDANVSDVDILCSLRDDEVLIRGCALLNDRLSS